VVAEAKVINVFKSIQFVPCPSDAEFRQLFFALDAYYD
jgi:hypothetical protein